MDKVCGYNFTAQEVFENTTDRSNKLNENVIVNFKFFNWG